MPPATNEFALILGCARNAIDDATAEHLRTLLQQPLDWDPLFREASRHGVMPLVQQTLRRGFSDAVPQAALSVLTTGFFENVARGLYLSRALSETAELLANLGIRALPYKGPMLASSVYGNLGLRMAGDLDFLVHPRDFAPAGAALLASGFRIGVDCGWKYHLARPADNLNIDLHSALVPRRYACEIDFDALWQRSVRSEIAGISLPDLSREDLLLVLCLNLAKDVAQRNFLPLIKICDVRELLDATPELDWAALSTRAERMGALGILSLGLWMADGVFGVAVPPPIRKLMSAHPCSEHIAQQTLWVLGRGDGAAAIAPGVRTSELRCCLELRERRIDRVRLLLLFSVVRCRELGQALFSAPGA
jgi:Uncharacterised nucleotidyltransferase